LREYLVKIGCGKLQASVWITPYNPIDTIRTFIDEKYLAGTVIVSDMGQGAAIGEENLESLIVRVYQLEDLEDRYEAWLDEYGSRKHLDHWAAIQYLSILSDDPQLPFPLLPGWWKGDKAYKLVKPILKKING
jgi:DNA-binding transcriptional regulator PaaX